MLGVSHTSIQRNSSGPGISISRGSKQEYTFEGQKRAHNGWRRELMEMKFPRNRKRILSFDKKTSVAKLGP